MSEPPQSKANLRTLLRKQRRALSAEEQLRAAQSLVPFVERLPGWQAAGCIALYCSADGEIDPIQLAQAARTAGKQVVLPVVAAGSSLEFACWNESDALQRNRFNIAQPSANATRVALKDIEIMFLPLVGWDRSGGRLGMGGGFYDRTLVGSNGPLRVGLAHALQEVEAVPCEDTDIRLHFVATDAALVQCQPAPDQS